MPRWAEKKARKQGGVKKWRVIKRGGKTMRCMITRKKGKRGGQTVCYRIKKKKK